MAERAVNNYRRKSMLNLQLHTADTFEEIVRKKLECGKFLTTKTGWIKIFGVFILIAAISMYFGVSECEDMPSWYRYLFPICIGASIVVQSSLYLIFSFGLSTGKPGMWIKMDIILNTVLAILSIIAAVMTYNECNRDAFQRATGGLGIAGGVVLLIGCAAIFLFYRYKRDDSLEEEKEDQIPSPTYPRKSMHV